jgi:hypothetical protein
MRMRRIDRRGTHECVRYKEKRSKCIMKRLYQEHMREE